MATKSNVSKILSVLLSCSFLTAISVAVEPRILLFNRQLTKLSEQVDLLTPASSESEIRALGFRVEDLKSGQLYLHWSVDRLRVIQAHNELFDYILKSLSDSDLFLDLAKVPAERAADWINLTSLRTMFGTQDGRLVGNSRLKLCSYSTVWLSKGEKYEPLQCFSLEGPRILDDAGTLMSVPDYGDQRAVVGARYWGVAAVGSLSRKLGHEQLTGQLLKELSEKVDSAGK